MASSYKVAILSLVILSLIIQSFLLGKVTIDNDELAYAYDAYLVSRGENPLSFGAARGFGLWFILAGWVAIVGLKSFVLLKGFFLVFYLLTVLAWYLIFRELKKPLWGLITIALFSLSPYLLTAQVYLHSQNIQIPALLFGIYFYLLSHRNPLSAQRFVLLSGILLGYAFITRESSAFHIIALALAILLYGQAPLRHKIKKVLSFGSGVALPVGAMLFFNVRTAGLEKTVMLFRRFTEPTTGATAGSAGKNIVDMFSYMHLPYSTDLLFLFVFGIGFALVLLHAFKSSEKQSKLSGIALKKPHANKPKLLRFGATFLLALTLVTIFALGLRLYINYRASTCFSNPLPDAYCLSSKTQAVASPLLAGIALLISVYLLRNRGKHVLESVPDHRLILLMLLLLLPPFFSYLKHVRFTVQYLFEFYPGVIVFSSIGIAYLWERKEYALLGLLLLALAVSYSQAWYLLIQLPPSGSYTYHQIDQLKQAMTKLATPAPPKIFTASVAIAKLIGSEPLLHISHPISYGFPLAPEIKYALYPRPQEIVAKMQSECNVVILNDLLTKQSYFEEEGPLQQYVEENFREVFSLESERRTKILVRNKPCPP
jgi:hypothetical protein